MKLLIFAWVVISALKQEQIIVGDQMLEKSEMTLSETVLFVHNERQRCFQLAIGFVLCAMFGRELIADSHEPFHPARYVAEDGKHYVVAFYRSFMNNDKNMPIAPVQCVFMRRQTHANAVGNAILPLRVHTNFTTGGQEFFAARNIAELIGPDDDLLCTFVSTYPPRDIIVTNGGREFVLLDNHGPTPRDAQGLPSVPSMVCVEHSGRVRFRKYLTELVDVTSIQNLKETAGHLDWLSSAMVDTTGEKIVLKLVNGRESVVRVRDGLGGTVED